MIQFILTLVPLAALDASSAARPAILALLLGSKNKPVLCGTMYVVGTFVIYMIYSLLFVLGLGEALEKFAGSAGGGAAERIINPEKIDYLISFVIGILLLYGAWHFSKPPRPKEPKKEGKGFTPRGSLIFGLVSNAIIGPGILPSFAAWNQVMKSDFGVAACAVILVIYNLLVVSPLIVLTVLRAVSQERADRVFAGIARFFSVWGRRFVVVLFLILGLVMIADAVGFFFGHPLIPVGSPDEVAG